MRYSWDPRKNRANILKHEIAFEDAVRIFDGPLVEVVDDRFDYGEIRLRAIGLLNGYEIVVAYTDRGRDERRIISARKADSYERRYFWKIHAV